MPGPLQRGVGPRARGEDVDVRVQLVRSEQLARARHGHAMVPAGAALSGEQVVVTVAAVQVRGFGQAVLGPGEDIGTAADQAPFLDRVFLQHDAGEALAARAVIPQLVQEVLAPVVVVEQRWIEAAAVHVHRIGPRPVDARADDQVIMEIAQRGAAAGAAGRRAAIALDIGVDQPEQAVRIRQARRPHAAGIGRAAHVQLAGAIERPAGQAPVDQVARVVDLHPRIPFEGGGGDVVVVADPHDGRVGIESAQDRVVDHVFCIVRGSGSRTRVHSSTAAIRSSTARLTKKGV